LYIGEKQAIIVQEFQTLQKIVSMALGGSEKGKSDPASDPNVNLMVPKTGGELKAAFGKVFG
jgi:hypothetical protein